MGSLFKISRATTATPVTSRGVTVRIGLFFDGTGNNKVNSQIAADCRAQALNNDSGHSAACAGRHANPASSYANDVTNIARLSELYSLRLKAHQTANGLCVSAPIYIPGIGTTSGKQDSVLAGQSFGRGSTGVLAKVTSAVKQLREVLSAFQVNNPDCVIEKLEFDLFGFSRGAAAARHFANEILKQGHGDLDPLLKLKCIAWSPGFSWQAACVQVKFIGLFDTVSAIGSVYDLANIRDHNNTQINIYLPPGCAQQVVQLVAGDELRRNFPLSSVCPGWTKEIVLPGSHSDIGGGYHLNTREKILLTRPRRSIVPSSTSIAATSAWQESQADMQAMNTYKWLDPIDASASLSIDCHEHYPNVGSDNTGVKAVLAAVSMDRRVYGHLSRIYLRVMHELATAEGVPLDSIPSSPALGLVPELEIIANKLIAYAKGGTDTLNDNEWSLLRRRYIHRSAHWSALVGTGASRSKAVFVHAPEQGGRVIHPNIGQRGYPQ